jgi:hypothetical protein
MNTNDMDRYYWRTGNRWSGDTRPEPPRHNPEIKIKGWAAGLLVLSCLGTAIALLVMR